MGEIHPTNNIFRVHLPEYRIKLNKIRCQNHDRPKVCGTATIKICIFCGKFVLFACDFFFLKTGENNVFVCLRFEKKEEEEKEENCIIIWSHLNETYRLVKCKII